MPQQFFVPKFITIEDKLAGILTFKQLFALLGAFLLSYLVFRINTFLGIIVGLTSFALAILLTFVYINGKPFLYNLPGVIDFFFKNRKFTWKRIEKVTYKEIELPKELETEADFPKIPQRKIIGDRTEVVLESPETITEEKLTISLEYPEVNAKEKLTISLEEPIALQTEEINRIVHRHLLNPKNPYRFFPYVKFYKTLK